MRLYLFCIASLLVPLAQAAAPQAGDAKRGAQAFRACMSCHSLAPGEQLTGPSLAHIWKRKAGTVEGFHRYSEAMKRAEIVWDEATPEGGCRRNDGRNGQSAGGPSFRAAARAGPRHPVLRRYLHDRHRGR